ncbi:DMT family transporter [Hydrogenophaga laconesensis]|uniref:Drug/metabolite transporter (DMT)-like permease n=1 Tax=Hydrogenophaga laconesensis TaxID=1805971 RepID=A0ABU1VC79_9BURK|nr:DMT family transporter [Hydrogenophaga laconesensis]MDR7095064.1 drug/metabolite transporter (DMT)-like permease [Hydrogenophaga laconesensis]
MPPNPSTSRLTPTALVLLTLPPLLWAGNAVVGRLMQGVVPPITLNFLRWALAFCLLLPMAGWVLRRGSGLWTHWRRFALLGLLGVGSYNALQYMALKTSTPMNVTLVAASSPVWMLLLGRLLYGVAISRQAALGAALSLAGVAVVLSRGHLEQLLAVQLVPGDAWILLAAILWAWYSWQLARPGDDPVDLKADWAAFLMAQIVMGLFWSGLFSAGEWLFVLPEVPAGESHIHWGWSTAAALLFFAIGPSLIAYRCWGAAVARVGPAMASLFQNLTALFAALLSATVLGEPPRGYHIAGFMLIVGGILVSPRR